MVIAASMYGKFKTTFQILMVCFLIADINNPVFEFVTNALIWIALILTVVSLVDYIYKNRNILIGDKM